MSRGIGYACSPWAGLRRERLQGGAPGEPVLKKRKLDHDSLCTEQPARNTYMECAAQARGESAMSIPWSACMALNDAFLERYAQKSGHTYKNVSKDVTIENVVAASANDAVTVAASLDHEDLMIASSLVREDKWIVVDEGKLLAKIDSSSNVIQFANATNVQEELPIGVFITALRTPILIYILDLYHESPPPQWVKDISNGRPGSYTLRAIEKLAKLLALGNQKDVRISLSDSSYMRDLCVGKQCLSQTVYRSLTYDKAFYEEHGFAPEGSPLPVAATLKELGTQRTRDVMCDSGASLDCCAERKTSSR